jgi:hypothetical protein
MKFLRHLLRNRELYAWPLAGIAVLVASLHGVTLLTGRAVIDDPGAIIGFLYNALGILVLVILVGATQEHLFGFRVRNSERATMIPRLRNDIYDSCVSAFLFILFAWLLWH